MMALTGSEVHRLLEACEGKPWHPIFHTLTWTGLRRSALLGLRWRDVDLLMATLKVAQTLQRLNTGDFIFQEPKTSAGWRTIALSPASCLELRNHREKQERDAGTLGIPLTGDTLVFSHPDGSPRVPSTLTLAFRRLTKRVGLEGVRLHDLRHTMASLYLQQGVSPKTVAERLGHASVVITLDLTAIVFQAFRKPQQRSLMRRWNQPGHLLRKWPQHKCVSNTQKQSPLGLSQGA